MRKFLLWVADRPPVRFQVPDDATLTVGRASEPGASAPTLVSPRGPVLELRVPNETLSSEHAWIRFTDDGALVRDLGSKNGTFLLLAPGEERKCTNRVQLGPYVTIELRDAGPPAADELFASTPEELRRCIELFLGSAARAVRLVSSWPAAEAQTLTALPLSEGLILLVEWATGTVDFSAERWVRLVTDRANLRATVDPRGWSFTAASRVRRAALDVAVQVAPFELPVLLLGKSGTGKGVLARDIHDHSRRASGPFVEVNCAGIPQELFESWMFGHAQGAFTGAHKASLGLVDAADGGTLFLDEVGELPASQQAKLLKFLDDRQYYPVGSSRPRRADVRIITATNRDLVSMIPDRFRGDLYYRIATLTIDVPEPAAEDIRKAVPSLLSVPENLATPVPENLAT